MKKISQIIARSAFSIALSGALIAAVPGCGRNNTAGTPGAGEFSGSGFSSESDSSFGESDDAAFEATLSADEEALFSDSGDQLSGVFDTTSDLADPTADSASDSITGYDASLDTVLPHALEALLVGMGGVPLVDECLALCPVVVVNLFVLVAIVFAYLGTLFLAAEVCLKLLDVFVIFGANLDELCSLFLERVYLGREILGALIEEVDNHKAHCHDNQQEHGRRHTAIELAP